MPGRIESMKVEILVNFRTTIVAQRLFGSTSSQQGLAKKNKKISRRWKWNSNFMEGWSFSGIGERRNFAAAKRRMKYWISLGRF